MGAIAPIFVELRANAKEFTAAMDDASLRIKKLGTDASAMDKLGVYGKAAALGITAGFVAVTAASVDMAANVQSGLAMIQAQAHVSGQEISYIKDHLIAVSDATGTATEPLINAFYHAESAGFREAAALDLVKTAALGAKVGHADLEGTINALTATMVAGFDGIDTTAKAMGGLNAIVGAGDMQMQDLNEALSGGVLASLKGLNVSFTQTGAALATFGDNNIRGAVAATQLRMAVQSIAKPAVGGEAALAKLGITSDQLKQSLSKGGLTGSLDLLHAKLLAAGYTADDMGTILTDAFGKKGGTGLVTLLNQFDRYNDKLKVVAEGEGAFGDDVKTTQATMKFQMAQGEQSIKNLGLAYGQMLLPYVQDFMHVLHDATQFITEHKSAMIALGVVFGTVLVASIGISIALLGTWVASLFASTGAVTIASTAVWEFTAALLANPLTWVVLAVVALGVAVYEMYQHWKPFRDVVNEVGRALKEAFLASISWITGTAWPALKGFYGDMVAGFRDVVDWFTGTAWPYLKLFWAALKLEVAWVVQAWKEAWAKVQPVLNTVGSWFEWLANWIRTGPAALMKEIIADVVQWWAKHGADIVHDLHAVGEAISVVWRFISSVVRTELAVLTGIFDVVWPLLSAAVVDTFNVIRDTIVFVWRWVSDLLITGIKVLADFWKPAWDGFRTTLQVTWDIIWGVISTVWNVIADLFRYSFKIIGDYLGIFVDLFSGNWSQLWSDAKSLVSDIWHGIWALIKDVLGGIWDTVKAAGGDIAKGLSDGLGDLWNSVKSAFSDLYDGVVKFFSAAGSWLLSIGEDIINGLISGIENAVGGVKDAVEGVANSLPGWAKSALGINSPSKVFHAIGLGVGEGWTNGIIASGDGVVAAVMHVARRASAAGALASVPLGASLPTYGSTLTTQASYTALRSIAGGQSAQSGDVHTHVYLDGKQIYTSVQSHALAYQRRNRGNGLAA